MKIVSLSNEEAANSGFTMKVVLDLADIKSATSGAAKELFTVPAGTAVRQAGFRLITPADGGNTSNLTMKLGDGGDDDRFIVAKSIHEDSTEVLYWIESATTARYAYEVSDTVDVIFTVTGSDGIAGLTQGEVEIYLGVYDLKRLGEGRSG
jgi:hypothetical protein